MTDESARRLFLTAGYLAPNEPIPPQIFERALEIDAEACDHAVDRLLGLGLLKEGPAVHPLLAEFARALAPPPPRPSPATGEGAGVAAAGGGGVRAPSPPSPPPWRTWLLKPTAP